MLIKSIYYKKSYWKLALLLIAMVLGALSILYTNRIVKDIEREEQSKMNMFARAIKELSTPIDGVVINQNFLLDYIRTIDNIPVIVVDDSLKIIEYRNIAEKKANRKNYLMDLLEVMRAQHAPISMPLEGGYTNYIYYSDSDLLYQLRYYPYFQIGVIGLFLLVSYLAFHMARNYEQDFVWVGMAKETAHQLGTPISSLMAWVEYLKVLGREEDGEMIAEIERDIQRLSTITDRFGKIGSIPKLEPTNLGETLETSLAYMRARVPSHVKVTLDDQSEGAMVALNKPLFDWVVENLAKNAIDAMEGFGEIVVRVSQKGANAYIDFIDTGKGIPANLVKSIFKPGITTKQRGWGLGLTLAKRIIENYHRGKIFVKESKPSKGTTFRIIFPLYKWS